MHKFDMSPFKPGSETWDQYVIRAGQYTVMGICSCCLIITANGDPCGEDDCETCRPDGQYEKYFIAYPGHVTLGAFTDDCGHDLSTDKGAREHTDICEDLGYRTFRCTLCGQSDHGDRYAAIHWPARPEGV